jgi:hypothetical protein
MLLLACLSSLAFAQAARGYAFFAPGRYRGSGMNETLLHFGGGAKYIGSAGLGFGGELAIGGQMKDFGSHDSGRLSLNAYYQKKVGSSKLEPFVTAGYTARFGHSAPRNWVNVGIGADYWVKNKFGLTVEFRDHLHHAATLQAGEVRFGVAFR